jgi:hypothetical protein
VPIVGEAAPTVIAAVSVLSAQEVITTGEPMVVLLSSPATGATSAATSGGNQEAAVTFAERCVLGAQELEAKTFSSEGPPEGVLIDAAFSRLEWEVSQVPAHAEPSVGTEEPRFLLDEEDVSPAVAAKLVMSELQAVETRPVPEGGPGHSAEGLVEDDDAKPSPGITDEGERSTWGQAPIATKPERVVDVLPGSATGEAGSVPTAPGAEAAAPSRNRAKVAMPARTEPIETAIAEMQAAWTEEGLAAEITRAEGRHGSEWVGVGTEGEGTEEPERAPDSDAASRDGVPMTIEAAMAVTPAANTEIVGANAHSSVPLGVASGAARTGTERSAPPQPERSATSEQVAVTRLESVVPSGALEEQPRRTATAEAAKPQPTRTVPLEGAKPQPTSTVQLEGAKPQPTSTIPAEATKDLPAGVVATTPTPQASAQTSQATANRPGAAVGSSGGPERATRATPGVRKVERRMSGASSSSATSTTPGEMELDGANILPPVVTSGDAKEAVGAPTSLPPAGIPASPQRSQALGEASTPHPRPAKPSSDRAPTAEVPTTEGPRPLASPGEAAVSPRGSRKGVETYHAVAQGLHDPKTVPGKAAAMLPVALGEERVLAPSRAVETAEDAPGADWLAEVVVANRGGLDAAARRGPGGEELGMLLETGLATGSIRWAGGPVAQTVGAAPRAETTAPVAQQAPLAPAAPSPSSPELPARAELLVMGSDGLPIRLVVATAGKRVRVWARMTSADDADAMSARMAELHASLKEHGLELKALDTAMSAAGGQNPGSPYAGGQSSAAKGDAKAEDRAATFEGSASQEERTEGEVELAEGVASSRTSKQSPKTQSRGPMASSKGQRRVDVIA